MTPAIRALLNRWGLYGACASLLQMTVLAGLLAASCPAPVAHAQANPLRTLRSVLLRRGKGTQSKQINPSGFALGGQALAGAPNTGGGQGAAPQLRQVATRAYWPLNASPSGLTRMSRSWHIATDTLTSVQLVLPGSFVTTFASNTGAKDGSEVNQGAVSITASIEYPAGTFTQVTFGGSVSGSQGAGVNLVSDPVAVNIPRGGVFYDRIFASAATSPGLVYSGYASNNATPALGWNAEPYGDGMELLASGGTDKTMAGTVAGSGTFGICYYPLVVQNTTSEAALILGDSRDYGTYDTADETGDTGQTARSIGALGLAYANYGIPSDRNYYFVAGHSKRADVFKYFSRVIVNGGINDVRTGSGNRTDTQLEADKQSIFSLFNVPVYAGTLSPADTSTDNFVTTGNQTPETAAVTRWTNVNSYLRAKPGPLTGVIDIAAATGGDNTWFADGSTANLATYDGLHGNLFGYKRIVSQGVVNIGISGPLMISTPLTPAATATVGNGLIFSPSIRGGAKPYTATLTGSPPSGLTINASTGAVSGTLAAAGSYTWGVLVTDSAGATVSSASYATTVTVASSAWTPAQLGTKLASWLRPDTGVTLNGATVSSWAAQNSTGSSGGVYSQATAANQPAFNSADAAFGNQPSVAFNGTSTALTGNSTELGLTNASPGFTEASVFKPNAATASGTIAFTGTSGSTSLSRSNLSLNAGKVQIAGRPADGGSASTITGSTVLASGAATLQISEFNTPAGTGEVRVNGTVEGTSSTVTVAATMSAANSGGVAVGGIANASSFANVTLAERVAIRGVLTTLEKQKLEGYFANRYGLQGLLPAGHPYKSSPP